MASHGHSQSPSNRPRRGFPFHLESSPAAWWNRESPKDPGPRRSLPYSDCTAQYKDGPGAWQEDNEQENLNTPSHPCTRGSHSLPCRFRLMPEAGQRFPGTGNTDWPHGWPLSCCQTPEPPALPPTRFSH